MSSSTTKARTSLVITIDGPVAAGKTSAARGLAVRLGLPLLDTGAIYRCVALATRQQGLDWSDESAVVRVVSEIEIACRTEGAIHRIYTNNIEVSEAIRRPDISQGASIVSALPGVRSALLHVQRQQAAEGRLIAEGRDTGTVVFADADCKFFLTARPEVRAHRRHLELRSKGIDAEFRDVLAELEMRDPRDSTRAIAPLVPAADATTIDSSDMSAGEVIAEMRSVATARLVNTGS